MSALDSIQNNVVFQLRGTLTKTGTSVTISDDVANGGACAFTDASIIIYNADNTVFERVKGTASGGTLTLSKRGIKLDKALTEDATLKREWRAGAYAAVTVFASDMADIEWDVTINGNITPIDPTKPGFRPQSLTKTQIDALPTTGQGLVFNSTLGLYQVLQGGTWNSLDTGTVTPNASETVSGKVEIATQAQTDAGTETGETGAILSITPKTLLQHVTNVTASTAEMQAGTATTKYATAKGVQEKVDYTRASDAEATAGTDTVKFTTPKQMKDRLDARLTDNVGAYVSKTWGTTYLATESGTVVAKANSNSSSLLTILGYVWASSPAATLVSANNTSGTSKYAGISFPVAKGQYYMASYSVNGGISEETFYFVPNK